MTIRQTLAAAMAVLLGMAGAMPAALADALHCNVSSDYDLTLGGLNLQVQHVS
ncbi:hypothetical protein LL965_20515 [Xanthomonas cassavae CFBP 4642]|uniref:Uncharacterized protein n=1 Tax=Xanthomonas cassavae CFBP 4642 TaxID=1219375 RepID=A0ABS8HJF4_9XANT|nr:hypothetical protein [Xanthomonas cassavae]MCC4622319.1 hypothetical protein [Xanthomonas cassavae CFBP 4642]